MLADQFARGLWPDAINARDIVDTVTHQRQDIAYKLRLDAKLLFDFGDIDTLTLHRVEHIDGRTVLLAD